MTGRLPTPTLLLLAAVVAWLYGAPAVRAGQSAAEATATLTSGEWQFGGRSPGRYFKPDGTYSSTNATGGTWKIANNTIEIKIGNVVYLYPLPVKPEGTPGADRKGRQSMLVRMDSAPAKRTAGDQTDADGEEPEADPVATRRGEPSLRQAAAQIVREYHNSLVFVTGTSASGSGFIASMAGGNFLVTNAHVAAGIRDAQFRTLGGAAVRGDVPSIAVGEDIFCMSMPAGGNPLPVMKDVDVNAAIGDPVAVLGNAEGGGVVNTITGRIVGIGPNLVEVSAPFVPGNSGSPIIHLKSGKVIGVATYAVTRQYDPTTYQKLEHPVIRRFGYRLDSVKAWQTVGWPSFYAQAAKMDDIEALTGDFELVFHALAVRHEQTLEGGFSTPLISKHYNDWLYAHTHQGSGADARVVDANFLSFLKTACESDVTEAQSQITYDYFRRELADQKEIRDQMEKGIDQAIELASQ